MFVVGQCDQVGQALCDITRKVVVMWLVVVVVVVVALSHLPFFCPWFSNGA
jgi:hypothetical protein